MNVCPQCRKHTPDGDTVERSRTCPECLLLNATLEHNKRQEAQQREMLRMQQNAATPAQARYPAQPGDLEALMMFVVGVVGFLIAWIFLPESWPGWVRLVISGTVAVLGGALAKIIMIAVLGVAVLVGSILFYSAYKRPVEPTAAVRGSAPVAEQRSATPNAQPAPPAREPAVSDRR